MKSICKFLTNSANSLVTQRVTFLFCRFVKGAINSNIVELSLEVIFGLMEMLPSHMQENVLHATLVSLSSKSRDTGLSITPYIQLLRKLANSKISGLVGHLSRVITSMRQCYKLVGHIESIESL